MYGLHFPVRRSFKEGRCSMRISEDVRNYAAQRGIAGSEALIRGLMEKAKEFTEKGLDVFAKL